MNQAVAIPTKATRYGPVSSMVVVLACDSGCVQPGDGVRHLSLCKVASHVGGGVFDTPLH